MNLILGTIDRLPLSSVSPFVDSLLKTTYDGDVVMFTRDLSTELNEYLRAMGVINIPFRRYHPRGIRYLRQITVSLTHRSVNCSIHPDSLFHRWIQWIWHCQASRYFMYDAFIAGCNQTYERVMLADVRDVIFQDDPFREPPVAELEVFQEFDSVSIAEESFNRRWIESMFGKSELNRIGHRPIICSGVTLGTLTGIKGYLNVMKDHLRRHHEPNGFDQGLHNYLIYNDMVTDVAINAFGHGAVMHVGIADRESLILDNAKRIVDQQGNVVPTVHQYDRHPWLQEQLLSNLSAA